MVLDKDFRKTSRNFRARIDLMNKLSPEESLHIFFQLCNFNLNNYYFIEKKRFPNKSKKAIFLEMHEMHEKLKGTKRIHDN